MGEKIEERKTEVLIVGAGPTGLFLAGLLHKYNVPFHIIDKKEGPTAESRALGVQPRTLEIFDGFGLADKVIERGLKIKGFSIFEKHQHLRSLEFSNLPTPYPFAVTLPQSETERILIEWLGVGGRSVDWKSELTAINPFDRGVEATIVTDGKEQKSSYNWVVGCDGINSATRQGMGIEASNERLEDSFGLADIKLSNSDPLEFAMANFTKEGILACFPLPNNNCRLVVNKFDPSNQNDQFWNSVLETRAPFKATIESIAWQSHFQVRYSLAHRFRSGRVFLCGDAAHVHSPIGGQGMNLGLQDAYNLAWKLSATIAGKAIPRLLHSYQKERRPIAQSVLRMTHFMSKAAFGKGLPGMFRPFILKHILNYPSILHNVQMRLAQLSHNYRDSPIIQDTSCSFTSHSRRLFKRGPHAGDRAPDAPVKVKDEDTTLFKQLPIGRHAALFFVLDGIGMSEHTHQLILRTKSRLHSRYLQEVDCYLIVKSEEHRLLAAKEWEAAVLLDETGELHKTYHCLLPALYIIRPDRYIGYRCYNFDISATKRYLNDIYELS